MQNMTIEEFIERARAKHGDKYDYSKTDLNNKDERRRVCIINKETGEELWQRPDHHLNCKTVKPVQKVEPKVKDTESFLKKAIKIYGDKYDFSKVQYVSTDSLVNVLCKKHGMFKQTPNRLLNGKGCPLCGMESQRYNQKTPFKEFVARANKIHNNQYQYDENSYYNRDDKGKIKIICPEHGEFWQTPGNHLTGQGCKYCNTNNRIYTLDDFIKKAQTVYGDKYDYSQTEWNERDDKGKIKIICPEHGEFWQLPSEHLKHGCRHCAIDAQTKAQTMTVEEFIQKSRNIHGDKYDYSKVDMFNRDIKGRVCIICPEHGEFWQTPYSHCHTNGCPKCGKESASKTLAMDTNEFILKARNLHQSKYDYSKVNYINNQTKVCIICPEHGEFWQTPSNHLRSAGCPYCGCNKISQKLTMTLDTFIQKSQLIHGNTYDYSNVEYVKCKIPICIVCPKHGKFWQTPDGHIQGAGCPRCSHHQSKPELEIIDFLKQHLKPEQIIERDREILEGKEIDILLPDFHVGIEFNGLYWHTQEKKTDINYHRNKMLLANQKGYRLIQIFEDEWLEHKEVVLNKLRHVINGDVDNPTIGARKTVIREINGQIAKEFLEQYHIQGYAGSSVYLGAYYKDELVGVMSFTEEQPKMWNLTRFATKTDYKLPGLANKMFKYFINNHEYEEIKSFLDLRWNQSLNNNTVYDKLGFRLERTTNPDYRYVVGNKRVHKFNFRKDKLHKKYDLPLSMTEREMCNKLGFHRIYDCGLAKYIFCKKIS